MKTQRPSIEDRRPILFTAGLLLSLSFTLVAFEWQTPITTKHVFTSASAETDNWVFPPVVMLQPVEPVKDRPAPPPPAMAKELKVVETHIEMPQTEPLQVTGPEDLGTMAINGEDEAEDEPYTPPFVKHPEVLPTFCTGEEAMRKKIIDNVRYPQMAIDNNISGVVYVTFVVRADGKIGDVTIVRGVDRLLDAEAVRVVKLLDCFHPGMQAGRPVNVPFTIPIRFKIT
jgi:periplasmic protein TonB